MTKTNDVNDKYLSPVTYSAGDICKTIQSLNSNKAYGHGNVSIWMLKICNGTINKRLELIFKKVLITGTYFSDWKKGNFVPVYKKTISGILKTTA